MNYLDRALEQDDSYYNVPSNCRLPHEVMTPEELAKMSGPVVIVKKEVGQ